MDTAADGGDRDGTGQDGSGQNGAIVVSGRGQPVGGRKLTTDPVASLDVPLAPTTVRPSTPLAAVVRADARRLLATGLVVTALVALLGQLVGVDHRLLATPVVDSTVETLLYARPVADGRLRLQLGALAGLAAVGVEATRLARTHDRVDLRRATRHLTFAVVAAPVGLAVGYVAVPLALDGLATVGATVPLADPYWVGEFALGLAVAGAGGLALPPLVVGAARAGVVARFSTGRQRGLATLGLVTVAAVYSPPDPASFAVVAAPLFLGLGAGLAFLEGT